MKWEYSVDWVPPDGMLESVLNNQGFLGWELFYIAEEDGGWRLVFKRPRQ